MNERLQKLKQLAEKVLSNPDFESKVPVHADTLITLISALEKVEADLVLLSQDHTYNNRDNFKYKAKTTLDDLRGRLESL